MKKTFWISALCIAFVTVMPVMAQDNGGGKPSYLNSPYYYVNVPIERIYPHQKGYVIDYQTGYTGTGTARTFIPLTWFEDGARGKEGTAPKGEIILLGPGNSWPYMTVYYKEGEFSHVRLYIRRERSHITWGGIPAGTNLDTEFDSVEGIKLQFSSTK